MYAADEDSREGRKPCACETPMTGAAVCSAFVSVSLSCPTLGILVEQIIAVCVDAIDRTSLRRVSGADVKGAFDPDPPESEVRVMRGV